MPQLSLLAPLLDTYDDKPGLASVLIDAVFCIDKKVFLFPLLVSLTCLEKFDARSLALVCVLCAAEEGKAKVKTSVLFESSLEAISKVCLKITDSGLIYRMQANANFCCPL